MKASSLSFQAAVLMVVAGMIWGLVMAISGNHASMPAHAHLNLLGWVSLFLFGIFYHLHPAIDDSWTAMVQVCIWIVATVIMTTGIGLVYSGHEIGDLIAASYHDVELIARSALPDLVLDLRLPSLMERYPA